MPSCLLPFAFPFHSSLFPLALLPLPYFKNSLIAINTAPNTLSKTPINVNTGNPKSSFPSRYFPPKVPTTMVSIICIPSPEYFIKSL